MTNPPRILFAPLLRLASVLAATLAVAGCGDSSGGAYVPPLLTIEAPDAGRCDPLDTRVCLFPFPNDFYTVEDPGADTGRRVALVRDSMPANVAGVRVDPAEWNRNDGFSPGALLQTYVAGLDVAASGIPAVTDIGSSLREDAPIVLIDAETGERKPLWAELDASVSSDEERALLIRPAVNLLEGHRHVVAMRGLVGRDGAPIAAGDAFRAMRDGLRTNVPEFDARRPAFERIFTDLANAGVGRDDLYLAWDFTVASRRNLTERVLRMRDDAFARLGAAAPAFQVTEVAENVDDRVARRVKGTFDVPKYLVGTGKPPARIHYGADGLPAADGTFTAVFECIVPHVAVGDRTGVPKPARPSLYGHGLLGDEGEVAAGNVRSMAEEHDFVFCATKWLGMSEDDVENAVNILQDLSKFPTLADRAQQGFVDFLFLGRLMIHPQGLGSHPAFQSADGKSVIDGSELFYDGNSQGGIMGGALTAISTDFRRAVLGVPGMNYSTLLQRSVDWDVYRSIYDPAYPAQIDRGLGLNLIQMLWDRAEANGFAQHMTDDPLPNTPPHTVLMHVAFGDWQVAIAAADVEARTIGARIHAPSILPEHNVDVVPNWGIEPIPSYPWGGSAIVVWDSGTPAPPTTNLAPSVGRDPHGDPRSNAAARVQKSEFLRTNGAVVDVCQGAPCVIRR